MTAPCLGCKLPTEREVELEFADSMKRTFACCEGCAPSGPGSISMPTLMAAYFKYGEMPLNPDAAARECELCGAADERKCGCL